MIESIFYLQQTTDKLIKYLTSTNIFYLLTIHRHYNLTKLWCNTIKLMYLILSPPTLSKNEKL